MVGQDLHTIGKGSWHCNATYGQGRRRKGAVGRRVGPACLPRRQRGGTGRSGGGGCFAPTAALLLLGEQLCLCVCVNVRECVADALSTPDDNKHPPTDVHRNLDFHHQHQHMPSSLLLPHP